MLSGDNGLSKAEKGEFKPLGEGLSVFPKGLSFFSVYMSLKKENFSRFPRALPKKRLTVYIFLGFYIMLVSIFQGNPYPSLFHVLDGELG